jgi:hypothetical protein
MAHVLLSSSGLKSWMVIETMKSRHFGKLLLPFLRTVQRSFLREQEENEAIGEGKRGGEVNPREKR